MLPPSPLSLRDTYPRQYQQAFASGDPIPCPHGRADLDVVVSAVPMRITLRRRLSGRLDLNHTAAGLSAIEPSPGQIYPEAMLNAFQSQDQTALLGMLAQVVQRLQHPSGAIGDGTPNLRISPFATPTPIASPTPLASPRESEQPPHVDVVRHDPHCSSGCGIRPAASFRINDGLVRWHSIADSVDSGCSTPVQPVAASLPVLPVAARDASTALVPMPNSKARSPLEASNELQILLGTADKRKRKKKGKTVAAPKHRAKATPATGKVSVKDPTISVEMSRNQVKAWTGKKNAGEYKIFSLKRSTISAAKTEAATWLIRKLKDQKRKAPPSLLAHCK